nr:phage tail protein [Gilliamella sp. N-G2]
MHRIDTSTAQRDKFGTGKNGFTRGNPQTGTPATQLDYLYCDAIQEEIANAIESAGFTLDKSKHNQLATAIKEFVSGAVKKTGDTMSGQLILSEFGIKHRYTDSENLIVLRTLGDNYSCMFYDAEKKQWLSKLVYNSTTNSWNFPSIDDVKINNKSVLKTSDYGIGSFTGAQLENPDETLLGGCYATRTTAYPDLSEFQNRNDSASLVVYPAWTKGWSVEKLAVVQGKTPRVFYRCSNPDFKQPFYEVITTANVSNYIPVGVPLPYPTNKPPSGWLECNGSWFDKNQFPKLAAAYPSGSLPDLRGVFIRGKDNGRGLDPNRAILSYQDDAIRNIYGELSPISESFGASPVATGAFRYFEKHADHSPAHIDVGSVGGVTFDASRVVATANENRPRNIAFMYIVKAE